MRLAVLAAGLIACGDDPSLSVEVEHPIEARVAEALRETTVSIYENAGLTCEQVELGDVAGDGLRAMLVAEVRIVRGMGTSGTFAGVSRLDHKVIVARGLGEKAALITAGCAELDEVHEGQSVAVKTVVAARVSIGAPEDAGGGILVTTTEPLPGSRSINGRRVSWRLYGPSGTSADGAKLNNLSSGVWEPKAPTCTAGGEATIHPVAPKVPAGYAVRLRVAWATAPPPLLTQITNIPHVAQALPGTPASAIRPCAVRRSNGTAGIVCITSPTTATEFRLQGGDLVASGTAPLTANADAPAAIISVDEHDVTDTRHVYAITERGNWQALFGAPGLPLANRNWWCPLATCRMTDVQMVPACGASAPFLLAKLESSGMYAMPLYGGASTELLRGREATAIATAGCLTELANKPNGGTGGAMPRQAIAINNALVTGPTGTPPAIVLFDCEASGGKCGVSTPTDGIGFVFEAPPRMIVGTFDASGTALSTVNARPNEMPDRDGKTQARFIELARQPAAAPPEQLLSGHFDDDKQADLLWYFQTRAGVTVQLAYARELDGTPITALGVFSQLRIEELFAADLNGDGIDEIIALHGPTVRALDVVPMGLPYPPVAPTDDPPCP